MFSLLTDSHKKELIKEYRLRLFVMTAALLIGVVLVAIVLLVPTYLRLKSDNDAAAKELAGLQAILSKSANPEITKATSDIRQNLPIAALDGRSSIKPIQAAIKDRVEGISLTGFEYKYDAAGSALVIKGVAETRDDLKQYGSNLSSDTTFKTVDLPISNFAKASDLDFSINASGAF